MTSALNDALSDCRYCASHVYAVVAQADTTLQGTGY